MIAFDTDVLTEVLLGNTTYVTRVAAIPLQEQAMPVIVVEEIMRGCRTYKLPSREQLLDHRRY